MTVLGVGSSSAQSLQAISQMRDQLDDLQRQLGTGQKSTTYAGLGLDRGLTIGLNSQLSAITGYQSTITQVGVRLDLMQTALTQFSAVAAQTKTKILQSQYALGGGSQTQDQTNASGTLDALLGMLNTQADGRYLFSGNTVDTPPVDTVDHILNGTGGKAGLKQVINERLQADQGASGLGRLQITTPGGNAVKLTEDAGPFGFKVAGVSTSIAGATTTPPTGTPPDSMTIGLVTASPAAGDTVKFTLTLPDGSSRDVTLTATNSATPAAGQFTIGGSAAATAASLQTALTQSITTLASTDLVAASALAAGNDFFNTDAGHPPQRVNGPPFDTATSMRNGTADTVAWYTGDNATTDPRQTALGRADQSLTVAYGARANEQGLRTVIQNVAVFTAMQFSASDPNGGAQYAALTQRIGGNLNGSPGQQTVSDIAGQLAGAQVSLNDAKNRHDQTTTTLQNLLQSVTGAKTEDVAAQIMSLQTSLQATLQTTAMLLQTNLLKYLPL